MRYTEELGTFDSIKNELTNFECRKALGKEECLNITELEVLEHLKDDIVDINDLLDDYKNAKIDDINSQIDELTSSHFYDIDNITGLINDLEELREKGERVNDIEEINIETLVEFLELGDYISQNNSYNWFCTATFDYTLYNEYTLIKFHRFGDVRGNYTDYLLLDLGEYEFIEKLSELYSVANIEIEGVDYSIQYNLLSENGVYNVYSDDIELYDTYFESDELENLKEEIIEKLNS